MNINNFTQSQSFKGILMGLLIAIVVLVIFQAGIAVGYRKATFGHRLGDNFERNFKDPRGGNLAGKGMGGIAGYPSGHGAAGKIVSISLPLVVVAGPDNLEKTVVIQEGTEIRQFRETLTQDKLQVGDFIIVLGTPNDAGQIEAKLIRLAPTPSTHL